MSVTKRKPPLRRAIAMHRIAKRIARILGPFTPREILLFEPGKGFSTYEEILNEHGKPQIKRRSTPGFFESLYMDLPASLQRRFLLLDEKGPAPTPRQYRVLEHRILGYARRKLMRGLIARINTLPRISGLPIPRGRNGGQLAMFDSDERQRIRKRVKELRESGNEGEGMTKTEAIATVAGERGITPRHTWRIVLGH